MLSCFVPVLLLWMSVLTSIPQKVSITAKVNFY
jgi:hypothetical protein